MKRMLLLSFGVLFVQLMVSTTVLNEWNEFKIKYSKQYHDETEENFRFGIFQQNVKEITEHNKLYDKGLVLYKMVFNENSDLTKDEFKAKKGMKLFNLRSFRFVDDDRDYFVGSHHHQYFHRHDDDLQTLPHSIDWREKGAVTGVRDQRDCGSCWAISAVGAIEGQYFLKTGKLVSLSVQNLVDCATDGDGCDGSYAATAFQYVIDHGIKKERSYPYKSISGSCKYHPKKSDTRISGIKHIPEGDENYLQEAIATIGPISVAIDGSDLQHYHKGIIHNSNCTTYSNHLALVVGYGTDENGIEYYILKNSYGKYWGEHGYFRLARNQNNLCGIASYASFPII